MEIAVVDYGMGNLHSVCKGLQVAGANPHVTDSTAVIASAEAIVLPGVGSFDPAVQQLRKLGLEKVIKEFANSGKPFLGICLGLQILFSHSEEGQEPGLDIIPGKVRRFQRSPGLTIPQMGWNQLGLTQPDCPLWDGLPPEPWFYFVHSYYVDPLDSNVTSATVTHGTQQVTAAIARHNLMAVQFHPEKSADTGLLLLQNFVKIVP
jgi:glutamine amidotransferase